MPKVADMVQVFLEENGYDGLWNSDMECACLMNDLCPGCECPDNECEPGYRKDCDCEEEHQFHVVSGPPKVIVRGGNPGQTAPTKANYKIEMRVEEGDMAWRFHLSIDGEDVVHQFVTPTKGMILKEFIEREKKDAKEAVG